MRRMTLFLLTLLFIPVAAAAQEQPRTYVIKKGDTLWGISERFLKDPYYWPNLWSHNPDIPNPHFIYPGQTVRIIDGRIELVPTTPAPPEPEVAATTVEPPPMEVEPVVEEVVITLHGVSGAEGFITQEELATAGTLVDTVDNRILMAKGETVFVQMVPGQPARGGDSFSLYAVKGEVRHPVTDEVVGSQISELGTIEVVQSNRDVATAVITSMTQEVERGAKLLPSPPTRSEIVLKKSDRDLSGYLVWARNQKLVLSQHDIVYIDLGSEDGLETGNLLYISRPRTASEASIADDDVILPDVLLGSAVVLKTRARTATAMILKSAAPIYRGDRVTTVGE